MGRREFLLGTLATVTAGIAGCSGLDDSETQGTYEPSAADSIAVAVGQLNKAALSLDEFQSGDGTNGDDNGTSETGTPSESASQRRAFDASTPRKRVGAAREAIARAEDNGAEQADVRAVRRYADGVGGTVDAVANVTTASNRLADVEDSFDDDDIDTDAASATLAEATTASAAARTDRADAETALESADGERLRSVEARYDALRSGVGELLGYVVGVDGLAVGYDTYVSGIDGVQTAEDEVDAEKFDAARESFSGARSSFGDAESMFTDAMEGAADDLQGELTAGEERSRALDRLSAGYISLLDSRDHVSAAESDIEGAGEGDPRAALRAGGEDATTASDRFEEGASVRDDEFGEEFQTAQERATAMQSLSDGYVHVLDARDRLEDGETAFREENYDQAGVAFSDAGATADRAETTFSEGEPGDEDSFFDAAFDRAFQRTSVLQSLSEGYGLVVQSRETAAAGRRELRARNFETAESKFQTADSTLGEAERVFAAAESEAGEAYGSTVDRALCRVGHLRNAMDHFVAASQAGSDRDRDRLDSQVQAGEADIDRAGEC